MQQLDRIEEKLDRLAELVSDQKATLSAHEVKIEQAAGDIQKLESKTAAFSEWRWKISGGMVLGIAIGQVLLKLWLD